MEIIIAFLAPFLVLGPLFYLTLKKSQPGSASSDLTPLSSPSAKVVPAPLVPVPFVAPIDPPQRPTRSLEDHPEFLDAKNKAREVLFEAREQAGRLRREAEEQTRKQRSEILELEKRVLIQEQELTTRLSHVEIKEKESEALQTRLAEQGKETEKVRSQLTEQLTKIAGLTRDEAKRQILENLDNELTEEAARRIKMAEEKIKEESTRRAKEILVEAMRRGATDYVAEYTVSVVKLPDEEVKGRIIGKEGRNIRSFELATGVDIDLDMEDPKEIRLSSFDSVRREIARVSLERLVSDGRIHPLRIEEVVEKTRKDLEKIMHEEGEKLAQAVGAFNLPPEIIDLLGRFKYRFSYGQNMIGHTLEETQIGLKLAAEVGADVDVVRLGCLLHDIGKVITEDEGTHIQLGADLLRKFKFPAAVIGAVAEHHEDKPFSSLESVLVYIADAISGSRPGARVEDIGAYVKRMKDLEAVALSFRGVKTAYALSAGREVRVIVEPMILDDASCVKLAHDVAAKIEKEQTYPGQVKVTVIREMRAMGLAK